MTVEETLDSLEEGGIVGLIKVNGKKKYFTMTIDDGKIAKEDLKTVMADAAVSLGIALHLPYKAVCYECDLYDPNEHQDLIRCKDNMSCPLFHTP